MRQLKISKQITNRESLSLDRYLQEIGKYDLLTAEDEVKLTMAIKEGYDMPIDTVEYRRAKIAGRHVSVDAPFAQGDDNRLLDVLQNDGHMPDHTLNRDSLTLEVERSLSVLAPREADVIRSYFGIGMDNPLTLEEIGEKFKLTRERVRQIKEKAIRRLRQSAYNKVLKEYIGS